MLENGWGIHLHPCMHVPMWVHTHRHVLATKCVTSLHIGDSIKTLLKGSSRHGSVVMNPTRIHEDAGLIPGLTLWIKDPVLQ